MFSHSEGKTNRVFDSRWHPVACFSEHGDEPLGSIKVGIFLAS